MVNTGVDSPDASSTAPICTPALKCSKFTCDPAFPQNIFKLPCRSHRATSDRLVALLEFKTPWLFLNILTIVKEDGIRYYNDMGHDKKLSLDRLLDSTC